jgi:hypothetical protein
MLATFAAQPLEAETEPDQTRTSTARRNLFGITSVVLIELPLRIAAMTGFARALAFLTIFLAALAIAADDGDDFSNNLLSDLAP